MCGFVSMSGIPGAVMVRLTSEALKLALAKGLQD
ncbi:hypothetical protein EC08BKT55439_2177, partial [Escherichia coli 08BKT055439]